MCKCTLCHQAVTACIWVECCYLHMGGSLHSCTHVHVLVFLVSCAGVLHVYDSLWFVSQAAMVGERGEEGGRSWGGIREEGRGHICWLVDHICCTCRCRVTCFKACVGTLYILHVHVYTYMYTYMWCMSLVLIKFSAFRILGEYPWWCALLRPGAWL